MIEGIGYKVQGTRELQDYSIYAPDFAPHTSHLIPYTLNLIPYAVGLL